MSRLNRTCLTCGEKYRYCPSCLEDLYKPNWLSTFHDENCKLIFKTLTDNYGGHITDEEAKSILEGCNLNIKFVENVQKDIDRIMDSKKTSTRKTNKNSE